MHRWDLAAFRRRRYERGGSLLEQGAEAALPADAQDWSWPPYAPIETGDEPFDTADWAPSSVVWQPQVRLGRWTVVYRRCH